MKNDNGRQNRPDGVFRAQPPPRGFYQGPRTAQDDLQVKNLQQIVKNDQKSTKARPEDSSRRTDTDYEAPRAARPPISLQNSTEDKKHRNPGTELSSDGDISDPETVEDSPPGPGALKKVLVYCSSFLGPPGPWAGP